MPSGLPTAPDTQIGFQPPPSKAPSFRKPVEGPGVPFNDETPVIFNPIIIVLIGYLEKAKPGAVDEAVAAAYKKFPNFMNELHIKDTPSFLEFANDLLKWIPHENFAGKDIYGVLCMFYIILDQPSLQEFQTPVHPSQIGQPLSWLSSWIVVFAQLIGLFMDTPASLTPESLQSFKDSPLYDFDEAEEPKGGFRTFNEMFSRRLKPGRRPIDSPKDHSVIVYPADCTYDNSLANHTIVNVESGGLVYIKSLPWTIHALLQGSEYADQFDGGIWMHAFLNTYNYHRQHAPVSGTVIEAKNIQGAAHLGVDTNKCQSIREMCADDAPDCPGYQFLQTRGLVVIDNPVLGKVAVLPIGMAMISGVKLFVKAGDKVEKGQEISTFLFGGSDIICVFQGRAGLTVEDFVPSQNNTYAKMGTVLARTRLPTSYHHTQCVVG
ncbi:uncharacterized protein K452DRAFT_357193 [Aplosporella prunicola CBS 121167]|uniref:L-tryptophan decarboxylase PsiD-like domain-containing protein n=1 Tax=Aplosporella prunicola CBS 121167 TaxID=1176127 RepID=A0A6A6BJK2_9PEZI|nr:uncharacterized protein K452DRAFT_357193 [Aplosporella prunicola CBS 121167]KAF2144340.1 hypothetical protein K452DRAFT_357193 [Aplosporella prunicola CBS 121167]